MKVVEGQEEVYRDWRDRNSDPYGGWTFAYAERWAGMLERKIEEVGDARKAIVEYAERLGQEADIEGVSGTMYGCAVSILSQCWEYGEELRQWHKEKYQERTEGFAMSEAKRQTTKEMLVELQESNAQMGEALLRMQERLDAMDAKQSHPLRALFGQVVSNVTKTAAACDNTVISLQKEKEGLLLNLNRTIEELKRTEKGGSTESLLAMEEAYLACERDIDVAISSVAALRVQLTQETVFVSERITETLTGAGDGILQKCKGLLEAFNERAKRIHANVIEKNADAHRKSASRLNRISNAIAGMDRGIYESRVRLKNAVHALKGESPECPQYRPSILVNKVLNSMGYDIVRQRQKADDLQMLADSMKQSDSGESMDALTDRQEDDREDRGMESSLMM